MRAYKEILIKLNICFFRMKSNEIIEKYNEIWKRASNSVKQWFDAKSVYNEKYKKTEIKSYNGKINTNFNNKEIETKVLNVFVYQ